MRSFLVLAFWIQRARNGWKHFGNTILNAFERILKVCAPLCPFIRPGFLLKLTSISESVSEGGRKVTRVMMSQMRCEDGWEEKRRREAEDIGAGEVSEGEGREPCALTGFAGRNTRCVLQHGFNLLELIDSHSNARYIQREAGLRAD